jgi:hypothetical protein
VTDESLYREVDEEVRQDEYKKLWGRHGKTIMAAIAAVVLGVAGYEGWKYIQKGQAEEAALVYLDAAKKANDGKFDDAIAAFAAVKHPGFNQLAKLREAAVLAEKGDVAKAIAAYDALIADASTDALLADVARIRAGYLLVDTATLDELQKKLGAYTVADSPWRHNAREIVGLAAYRLKDFTTAERFMNEIFADAQAPQAIKQRAQVMLQLIQPELPKK